MKRSKLIIGIISCLLFSQASFATSASIEAGQKTVTINTNQKRTVNVVTTDLNNNKIYLDATIGNNRVGAPETFSSLIKRKAPLASINANYFDAYKTFEPMGAIMREGRMEFLEGSPASLVATKDGKVNIGQYDIKINGYINGFRENAWNNQTQTMDFNVFNAWYVNRMPTDKSGVYIYTPTRGKSIKLNGGIGIEVINNKVTKVFRNAQHTAIPNDGYVIYFGDSSYSSYVDDRFKVGDTVELEYELVEEGQTSSPDPSFELENNLKTIISAGPYLVHDGKNVYNSNNTSFSEAKITTARAQRSAVGITKDNKLIMVTGSNLNMNELSQVMVQLGSVRAMNLDGGASSGLYGKGKTFTSPGRKLHTVLNVHQKNN